MEVLSYILTAFDELLKMNVLSTIVAKNEGLLQSIKAILFHLKMKKTRAFLVWKLLRERWSGLQGRSQSTLGSLGSPILVVQYIFLAKKPGYY